MQRLHREVDLKTPVVAIVQAMELVGEHLDKLAGELHEEALVARDLGVAAVGESDFAAIVVTLNNGIIQSVWPLLRQLLVFTGSFFFHESKVLRTFARVSHSLVEFLIVAGGTAAHDDPNLVIHFHEDSAAMHATETFAMAEA